jgi:thioredoxin 1
VDDRIQVAGRNTLDTEEAANPVVISVNDFESCILESQKPVVFYVHSERCRPCRVHLQIMRDLAARLVGVLDLFVLDGEQSPGVLTHLGITRAPTVVLIDNGQVLCIIEGITPVASLLVVIQSHFGISVSYRKTITKGG